MSATTNPVIAEDVEEILRQPLPWDRFDGTTVLISGAAGFLPAYLVETLARLNANGASIRIVCLVRNRQRAMERLGHLLDFGVTLFEHDVSVALPDDLPAADY